MNESNSYYVIMLVSLVILMCFSAFFSSSETAFSSANRIKLKNLAEKNNRHGRRARLALKILDAYDKLLSTVLIGNNAVNIAASSLATALFMGLFGAKGVGIATLVMTILLLIFSEITPKTLAKESPEITSIRFAPLLRFFMIILTPFNSMSSAWKKLIMKMFPVKHDRSTTEDELLTFVEEVRQEGGINLNEEHMIRQVIGFDDMKVSEIFTPRIDVEAVSAASSVEEIDRKFVETGFSRLPVFQETIDNVTGIVLLKDFYHEVMKGLKTFDQIVKPAVFVPKSTKLTKLLRTLQEKKAHLAVVVDEHGGTLGIVTIEDIVEELVGEIWDEHDEVVEPLKKNADGSFTALGGVNFKEMLEFTTGRNAPNIEAPNTTIANWCMETLGRLPRAGETLVWPENPAPELTEFSQNFSLTINVIKVIRQRIMEVKIIAASNELSE